MMPTKLPAGILVAIFQHLLALAEDGELEILQDCGFDARQIERLKRLSVSELGKLAGFPIFAVACDGTAIDRALKLAEVRQADAELQAEFLRRGATSPLMRELFRIDRNRVTQMRVALGIKLPKGRPVLPPEKIQGQVWLAWHASQDMEPRRRWLALADQFPELGLGTLFHVVTSAV